MRDAARKLWVGCVLPLALGTLCSYRAAADEGSSQDFGQIERGRYLTIAADCAACHTDPLHNTPFAGGRRIETPFGVVAAANITPDRQTGIGNWSDADFERALRQGVMPDGRRLYPAMPFPYFTRMTREDVLAIRAYLGTVAPVHHAVRSNLLAFPFNIRGLMRFWDAWYLDPGPYKADPGKSPAWNRGAYLVDGPGHCAACHSPKNLLGADRSDQRLRGYSVQGWFAPDITDDRQRGLGNWSARDIVEYLKSGHNRFAGASGPMAEEVANSSSKMSDSDLQAMAAYLKDQPGQVQQPDELQRVSPDDRVMKAGAAIYADRCAACHKADGTGIAYLIPDLARSSSADSRQPLTALRVVLRGAKSVATREEPTGPAMPAFGWQLTDAQIAAVTTYIRNSWGHTAPRVTADDVSRARKSLAARSD